ncbi:hypothetical protein [Flavobacterium sp.]|uniref:hypothetical protein n=1 Tax=Flavobacterium sp. TaxID=239 RepID=UPI003753304E
MKTNKLLILFVATLSLMLTNCSKSEDATPEDVFTFGSAISSNFSGKIVDVNSQPISNVTIKMSGKTVTTDANGEFTLSNVSVLEHFGFMTATKSGFLDGSRTVFPHDDLNTVEIMLLPMDVYTTIQTGVISTVTLPNTTKVIFDGAFMTENGSAYNGSVSVIVNDLPSNDPNVFKKMPGNLIGTRTDGSISGMETYGMINVEMRGSNNEKIQIATGHSANISLPIAPNQLDDAASTIPLWHFNETSGLWEEQGFARRVGNKYVGNVSHFSWWNNDSAYVIATLNVVVRNFDTTPVNGVRVTISRASGSTGDVLMDLGITGANGTLSAGVPKNEILTFRAYTPDGTLINTQVLPASSLSVRTVYVIIPVSNLTNTSNSSNN